MDLRTAYKLVTVHLLEVAGERGEESLQSMDKDALSLLALDMIENDHFTDKLVEAVEEFIEYFGDKHDLW